MSQPADIDKELYQRIIKALKDVKSLLAHLYVEDDIVLSNAIDYAGFDIDEFEDLIEDLEITPDNHSHK